MPQGKPEDEARRKIEVAVRNLATAKRNYQAAHPGSKIWGTPLGGSTSPAAERFSTSVTSRALGAAQNENIRVNREIDRSHGRSVRRRLRRESIRE